MEGAPWNTRIPSRRRRLRTGPRLARVSDPALAETGWQGQETLPQRWGDLATTRSARVSRPRRARERPMETLPQRFHGMSLMQTTRRTFLGQAAAGCIAASASGPLGASSNVNATIARIETFPIIYPTVGRFKFFEGPKGQPSGRPSVLVGVIALVPRIMRLSSAFSPLNSLESPSREGSSLASMPDTLVARAR